MKKLLFTLMFIVPILNGCNSNDDAELLNLLEEMKNQNEMMRQEIRTLQERTESLINSLDQNEQNTTVISNQLTGLQGELDEIMQELERLNAEMQSNNANTAEMQSQIDALNERFSEVAVELEGLQRLQEIFSSISQLQAQFTELESRADAILDSSDQTNNELRQIRETIAEVRTELNTVFNEVTQLALGLAASEIDIDTALTGLNFLESQLRTLTILLNQLIRSI